MEKFLEILKKYRDLIYISIIIIFGIIFSGQCSRIDNLNHEIDRQENNRIALTEQIVNYKDELGRANAEKHAYQLTQEELRDSIDVLKKKNSKFKWKLIKENDKSIKDDFIIIPSHLTKGLEFDCVIVYDCSDVNYTESEFDKKLLYVVLTRALHYEFVFYKDKFTKLLE